MSELRYDGRVAVVTGAGHGLGRQHALELAARGAKVVVNDLGGDRTGTGASAGPAQEVVDEIRKNGGEAVANPDNVATPEGAQAIVKTALDAFGKVDIVVNNAGILRDKSFKNMSVEEFDSVFAVHLKGHFAVARHAAARWKALSKETGEPAGGSIVNTASESGLYGNAGQANYAAAKAGIASLTLVMARELERIGVRVNAIAPVARTRLTEALAGDHMAAPDDGFDRFAPENVAAVAVWLASDLAAGISGQVVKVQGGQVQVLEGWRPLTEITDDKPWTLDSVSVRREELFAKTDGSVPAFFFGSPDDSRQPYPPMQFG